MGASISPSLVEGQSTNRVSLFNDTKYTYWKAHMKIFIQAQDYDIWNVIVKDPHTPTIKIDGKDIPKPKEDRDELDMKLIELNRKVINILYCALDANEFNKIFTYIFTKKI